MKNILFVLVLTMLVGILNAQEYSISGIVLDSLKRSPLIGANVLIIKQSDKSRTGMNTNNEGKFLINKIVPGQYNMRVTFVGYKPLERNFTVRDRDLNFRNILLVPDSIVLNSVTAEANMPLVEQNNDTLQYNAKSYKVREGADAGDLIKKMPGIEVDRSGNVKAQGETVQKILVDKKPVFDDAGKTLKAIPADLVKNVQVYDEQSEQSKFTGVPDGQTIKTINIVTKFEGGISNAQFDKVIAGYGTDDKYLISGQLNRFDTVSRISAYALSNNMNQNGFDDNTIKLSAFGNRTKRNMDSRINSGGIAYTGMKKTGINFSGNYDISSAKSNFNNDIQRDYEKTGSIDQFYSESRQNENKLFNHKLNIKIDGIIDRMTNFTFSPEFKYQDNKDNSILDAYNMVNKELSNKISNNNATNNKNYNLRGNLLINRVLSLSRNSISFSFSYDRAKNKGDENWDSYSKFYDGGIYENYDRHKINSDLKADNISSNLLYTHPLAGFSSFQLSYVLNFNSTGSDKVAYTDQSQGYHPDTVSSNTFNSKIITHKAGSKYSYISQNFAFIAGLFYNINKYDKTQEVPYIFNDNSTYTNLLPEAIIKFNFSKRQVINVLYNAKPTVPTIENLQDYIDRSNTLQISTGNKDLKESLTHFISTSFRFGTADNLSIYGLNINSSFTEDYIGSASVFAENDTLALNRIWLDKGTRC